jgi:riboflavin kinase / FMN adenylyltransferase
MHLFRGLPDSLDPVLRGGAVTWGVFDGVHRGHVKVIDALVDWARELGSPSLVITFDRHPAEVLHGASVPLVCPIDERVSRILDRGVDAVIILPFTVEFSHTPAEGFIRDIVHGRLEAKAVLLGHDSHFGRNREGDIQVLERVAGGLGLQVRSCEPELHRGRPMSSTLVREAVRAGDLAEAEAILGRPFALFGKVVKGEGRGAALGIPTANLELEHDLRPPSGVYAVEVPLDGRLYPGGANLGRRPTFHPEGARETVEVHLLDYSGPTLLDRRLEVRLRGRVRDERKFSGPDELVRQIRSDLEWIRSRAATWSSTASS